MPVTILGRLLIACILNLGALLLVVAWAMHLCPFSYSLIVAVVGWCFMPHINEVDRVLNDMRAHNKARE